VIFASVLICGGIIYGVKRNATPIEDAGSDAAKSDLKGIIEYLSHDSQQYADYFYERIFESIDNLKSFLEMGRRVPELKDPNMRELILQNYRIVYQYLEDNIKIVTIFHGKRLLKV